MRSKGLTSLSSQLSLARTGLMQHGTAIKNTIMVRVKIPDSRSDDSCSSKSTRRNWWCTYCLPATYLTKMMTVQNWKQMPLHEENTKKLIYLLWQWDLPTCMHKPYNSKLQLWISTLYTLLHISFTKTKQSVCVEVTIPFTEAIVKVAATLRAASVH